jgi:hypothetical protein
MSTAWRSFAIHWDPAALHVLYQLHPWTAAAVDRAVLRFAEVGEGKLESDPPYHRLRAATHDALLVIDGHAEQVNVIRIYRARRG